MKPRASVTCSICGYTDGEHNWETHAAEMRGDEQFGEDMRRGEYDDDFDRHDHIPDNESEDDE